MIGGLKKKLILAILSFAVLISGAPHKNCICYTVARAVAVIEDCCHACPNRKVVASDSTAQIKNKIFCWRTQSNPLFFATARSKNQLMQPAQLKAVGYTDNSNWFVERKLVTQSIGNKSPPVNAPPKLYLKYQSLLI